MTLSTNRLRSLMYATYEQTEMIYVFKNYSLFGIQYKPSGK
jgi:hypothetical protein